MLRRTTSLTAYRGFCTSNYRTAVQKNLNMAPKEHSCGIPAWMPPPPPPDPTHGPIPWTLIRPPCRPDQKRGEVQTCVKGQEGFYCVPCRLKYKYPPFSENIEFMPLTDQPPCWWKFPAFCELDPSDEEKVKSMTRAWKCAYESENWNF